MGTAPIAFGIGAGADARRPLGLAVVGGLIFSQMVTLYLTPVFYTYMDTFQDWLENRFGKVTGKGIRSWRTATFRPTNSTPELISSPFLFALRCPLVQFARQAVPKLPVSSYH